MNVGETEQPRVTVRKRVAVGLGIAIVAGLVTHFLIPVIEEFLAPPAVEITSPVAGEQVQWTPVGHLVTGTCWKVGGDLHLYVAIHPLATENWYVQRIPTIINSHWQAVVFFGMEEVGLGDQYQLCAFISSKTLHEGQIIPLTDFPPNHEAKAIIAVSRPATHD